MVSASPPVTVGAAAARAFSARSTSNLNAASLVSAGTSSTVRIASRSAPARAAWCAEMLLVRASCSASPSDFVRQSAWFVTLTSLNNLTASSRSRFVTAYRTVALSRLAFVASWASRSNLSAPK